MCHLILGANTDAIHVPSGTTGERPGSPAAGYFRYNSETGDFEGYTDAWGAIAGSGGTAPAIDTMTGDGSDTTLTLTSAPVNENATVVTIDGVVQHKDTYSVSSNTLTFSTAPPTGTAVECITWTNTAINSALLMQDADGDTQIQVEESSDEDKIRFDTAGTERMVIDNSGNVGIGTSSPHRCLRKPIYCGRYKWCTDRWQPFSKLSNHVFWYIRCISIRYKQHRTHAHRLQRSRWNRGGSFNNLEF
jgi:hypothetical protein